MGKTDEQVSIFCITQEEAAERLGVTTRTIRRWMTDNIIPTADVNGIKRVRGDLLDAWIDERTDPGKAPKR